MLLFLLAIATLTLPQCAKNDEGSGSGGGEPGNTVDTVISDEYVDLGLRSMTLWKSANEQNAADPSNGFYTYDEAIDAFGDKLPTKEQFIELQQSCKWNWVDAGYYIVVGPNKNYIIMPAAGFRDCQGGFYYARSYGFYWSSTPEGPTKAWYLNFYSGEVYMYKDERCYANSVRLVKKSID